MVPKFSKKNINFKSLSSFLYGYEEFIIKEKILTANPASPASPFLPRFPLFPGGPGGPVNNQQKRKERK